MIPYLIGSLYPSSQLPFPKEKKPSLTGTVSDYRKNRPRARSFMSRLGTRLLTQSDELNYKAVKMPRGEYTKHFRHDHAGTYVGTEPQREWTAAEIDERYGRYQNVPITSAMRVRGVTLSGGMGAG